MQQGAANRNVDIKASVVSRIWWHKNVDRIHGRVAVDLNLVVLRIDSKARSCRSEYSIGQHWAADNRYGSFGFVVELAVLEALVWVGLVCILEEVEADGLDMPSRSVVVGRNHGFLELHRRTLLSLGAEKPVCSCVDSTLRGRSHCIVLEMSLEFQLNYSLCWRNRPRTCLHPAQTEPLWYCPFKQQKISNGLDARSMAQTLKKMHCEASSPAMRQESHPFTRASSV